MLKFKLCFENVIIGFRVTRCRHCPADRAQISHFWVIFLSVLSADKVMISRDSMKLFDRKCARGN